MLSDKLEKALNAQVNEELYSSYLYMAMSANFSAAALNGVANWFHAQAQEEMAHAMKIYYFINERGGRAKLAAIKEPDFEWSTALAAFEGALAHERHITGCINDLMTLSLDEKDHATASFLKWFVDEQVEEEANADEMVQKLKMIGADGGALYHVDKELATRVFVNPLTAA